MPSLRLIQGVLAALAQIASVERLAEAIYRLFFRHAPAQTLYAQALTILNLVYPDLTFGGVMTNVPNLGGFAALILKTVNLLVSNPTVQADLIKLLEDVVVAEFGQPVGTSVIQAAAPQVAKPK